MIRIQTKCPLCEKNVTIETTSHAFRYDVKSRGLAGQILCPACGRLFPHALNKKGDSVNKPPAVRKNDSINRPPGAPPSSGETRVPPPPEPAAPPPPPPAPRPAPVGGPEKGRPEFQRIGNSREMAVSPFAPANVPAPAPFAPAAPSKLASAPSLPAFTPAGGAPKKPPGGGPKASASEFGFVKPPAPGPVPPPPAPGRGGGDDVLSAAGGKKKMPEWLQYTLLGVGVLVIGGVIFAIPSGDSPPAPTAPTKQKKAPPTKTDDKPPPPTKPVELAPKPRLPGTPLNAPD